MVKFLIGGIAGFDTDTFALVSCRDSTQSVPLGAAAGRCLQVLLEADGAIVTKKSLLAQGWEQYGAVVSDNNLSQSIVRIRKALQQLGADPAALVTLPRIGYRIVGVERVSPHTMGRAIAPSDDVTESHRPTEDREIAQKSTSSDEIPIVESPVVGIDRVSPSAPAEAIATAAASGTPRRRVRLDKATIAWLAIAFLSTAAALRVVPAIHGDLRSHAPAVQWVALDSAPDNRVFVPPSLKNDKAFIDDRLSRLSRTPPTSIDDMPERLVYLNGSQSNEVASYFLCLEPISHPAPDCVSYLLINHLTP
ncbi:winged helix-turn-helix domain-containing protein [Pandoraea oxalativorans]|uniref:OmpR/PhoB-type domain-containing protein n=1 Tax=Pandoraea oxalativorans TaxID=573737 RepID=A0A0E3YG81_9BURK|nr:winged helix-turn-helix domain-containing protein [Pandoraea oxalativorans]AKC71612.1 hypothetical protein MB84_22370 [Pandoraea oxalativorans]